MLPIRFVGHNPQASGSKFVNKGKIGYTPKLFFHHFGTRAGKGFPMKRKKSASRRGRGIVLLNTGELWSLLSCSK